MTGLLDAAPLATFPSVTPAVASSGLSPCRSLFPSLAPAKCLAHLPRPTARAAQTLRARMVENILLKIVYGEVGRSNRMK